MERIESRGARLVALLVLLLSVGVLAWVHRGWFLPAPGRPAASRNTPLETCLAERLGAVDRMVAEGVLDARQDAGFRRRAEEYCRGRFG